MAATAWYVAPLLLQGPSRRWARGRHYFRRCSDEAEQFSRKSAQLIDAQSFASNTIFLRNSLAFCMTDCKVFHRTILCLMAWVSAERGRITLHIGETFISKTPG